MMQILITDDHYAVRVGTALILQTEFEDVKIDEASSYFDTIAKIKEKNYDLIFLDVDMPDSLNKRMISELKAIKNDLKILIYTSYTDCEIAIQYIREGADGYLNKQAGAEAIVNTVNNMLRYGHSYPAQFVGLLARRSENRNSVDNLSERELQIFNLFAEGMGNLEISNLLGLKATTISTYKKRIFEKLNVGNILDLANIKRNLH